MSRMELLQKIHNQVLIEMLFESGSQLEYRDRRDEGLWMDFYGPDFDWEMFEYRTKELQITAENLRKFYLSTGRIPSQDEADIISIVGVEKLISIINK